jgi:hypothetical protein
MGICRNFSRHLTFSDISLFGLGFKHLFTMQEITRIKDVIQHTWENPLTGKLYRASFELFFIKVGIGPNLLDIPEHALFLATDSLVCSTVQFLQEFHISLQHDILLPPQRQYDSLIMDTLSQLQITQDELFDCNCCRLYLRALYLSDIVTGDGLEIAENAWSGVRDVYSEQILGHIGRNHSTPNGRCGIGVYVPLFVHEVEGFVNYWGIGLLTTLIGLGLLPLITVFYINVEIINGLHITCLSTDNDYQPFKVQDTHVILHRVRYIVLPSIFPS